MPRFLQPLLLAITLLSGAVLAGCVGAPVQEMSNARQAVKAAERAGAATAAPEVMGEAVLRLKSAESHLRRGEYRVARDEAEIARAKAVEARRLAKESAPKAPPQP